MLPTLNIVVYTDFAEWFTQNPLEPKGGLTKLVAFITDKTKQYVEVKFCFVSRHSTNPSTLITKELLTWADELWVFGHRMNDKPPKEPDNNLKQSEIKLLEEFIGAEHRVGIFLTGDHSQSEVEAKCEDGGHEKYSSLGRALGENIPIAGLFRDWEGPPTNCNEGEFEKRDNFNTQEGPDPCKLDSSTRETDELAQNIILPKINCLQHRLFTYVDSSGALRPITKLPDHTHEGKVLGAEEVHKKWREKRQQDWPANWPDPVVAAIGRDKRFPDENRISNLVVAFDGDAADLSRMVVDSSFHHYMDYNLFDIPRRVSNSPLPEPDSDLDQIAHYFGNLALWLAPKTIRDTIKSQIVLSLTRHMAVRQVWNHTELKVGSAAREVLRRTIGLGRLRWLIGDFPFEARDPIDDLLSVVMLGDENGSLFSQIMKPELPLGVVLRICDNFLESNQVTDPTRIVIPQSLWQELQERLFVTLGKFRTELFNQLPLSKGEK